jgi:hypothetical protein
LQFEALLTNALLLLAKLDDIWRGLRLQAPEAAPSSALKFLDLGPTNK